jgi:hypothetical protein
MKLQWLREARQTHGESRTAPEYQAYRHAMQRCRLQSLKNWSSYGGRGIEFRFTSYEEFLKHIGRKPTPQHSLDRIDNDGHYEKGNVRWATATQQLNNQRKTLRLTINGVTKSLHDWMPMTTNQRDTIVKRLSNGWCNKCAVFNGFRKSCTHRKS